jgi:predicted ABC-type ATPase
MANAKPHLYLIAGPNGAGKTTYAFRRILEVSSSTEFVNLDEIARDCHPSLLEMPVKGQRGRRWR